ncbi:MAG: GNAT family N-acetyltransferase [Acidimicrobiales bacterium]|nr:MAG: GNAT family N-acetyltransferase [Acidimicrobiales bacterium]
MEVGRRLELHLRSWVGEWPPPSSGVHIVGDPARAAPTWDGTVRPLQGVGNGLGTVIAVPPHAVDAVGEAIGDDLGRAGLGDDLGEILGVGPAAFGAGVFRTTGEVDPDVPDLGVWFEQQTDDLPEWLAPFNGPRLVAFSDDGRPIAGVGIKIHDRYGYEVAVVTDEEARGRGVARRLVASATRRILAEGAVPTYLHAPDNTTSARVAEAVGFADRGWTVHGLWPRR